MARQFGPRGGRDGRGATDPASGTAPGGARRYRTICVSDVHLGTRGAQADLLLDFLAATDSDTLFLVGDIVDGWKLKRHWFWPESHDRVLRAFFAKAKAGTRVVYIIGNHDESFRDHLNTRMNGIEILDQEIHVTADGRRFLVIHGDQFDVVVNNARWLAFIGDYAYRAAIVVNAGFNWVRRRLGMGYWSLSAYLKRSVKKAAVVGDFEVALTKAARMNKADGVICGHIHHAEMRTLDGIAYVNDGDWVEGCTALVEHPTGELEILRWADLCGWRGVRPATVPPPRAWQAAE